MTPLWQWPIETLAPSIRDGSLTPRALWDSCRQRIEQWDDELGSFVCLSDSINQQITAAEQDLADGLYRGPLHGIPIAIKDNYLTADMPTRAGSDMPDMDFPRRDASTVARLRAAGAIVVGKTQMHEFAWGTVTPKTRNPWNTAHIAGGSSGGSAVAVRAGFCPAALGSDTGGSVRIPASACGTVGLKPTYGRIGRDGIVPHSWSLDHAGPLCRTVADAALLLQVLAGADLADPACSVRPVPDYSKALHQSIEDMTIGVCRKHFFERNEMDVSLAVEKALDFYRNCGAQIIEFEVANLDYGLGAIFAVELASSSAYHSERLRHGLTSHMQDDVRTLVEMGSFVTGADYLKAEQFRRVLMSDFCEVFKKVDVVISPTMPLTAWANSQSSVDINGESESVLAASWRLTYPWNLTGLPAISIPCGFDSAGLPIGLQIAGKAFDEHNVLRAAHAYESAHDWHAQFPERK